jgi:hypothetical protein
MEVPPPQASTPNDVARTIPKGQPIKLLTTAS